MGFAAQVTTSNGISNYFDYIPQVAEIYDDQRTPLQK